MIIVIGIHNLYIIYKTVYKDYFINFIKMKIIFIDNKIKEYDVKDKKIKSLIQILSDDLKVDCNRIVLIYSGLILDQDKTFDTYEISKNDLIICIVKSNEEIYEDNIIDFSKLREKYKKELNEIKNMGFEDEKKILEAPYITNGSVTISLNKLFQ